VLLVYIALTVYNTAWNPEKGNCRQVTNIYQTADVVKCRYTFQKTEIWLGESFV